VLGHLDEEFVDAGPLHHVDEVDDVLDLDGDDKVGAGHGPEAGMDERLVEVEDQALLPQIVGMVGGQELHLVLGRGVLVQDLVLRFAGGVLRPLAVLVVVGGRIPRDGDRTAGTEGGGVGRRGAPDGLGGGRRAGILGDQAAAHHPEGFQEGVAGIDVDAAFLSVGLGGTVLLVGVAALDLVRMELVSGVVDGLAVGRDVDVRLRTGGVLPPGPGDGIGTPGGGGVAVLVGLGDEVGDGGPGPLILGGGRRRRGDGGLVVHVDRRAAPPGGDGGLLDARAAQVAPAAESGRSLGLVVRRLLGRGGRRGIRPGGSTATACRLAIAVAGAAGIVMLVVFRVGGPGVDVRAAAVAASSPTETAEADASSSPLLGRFDGRAVGRGHGLAALGNGARGDAATLSDIDRNDSVRGIDRVRRVRAGVLGLLLLLLLQLLRGLLLLLLRGLLLLLPTAAANEPRAADAGLVRLGQALLGSALADRRRCRRMRMDLLRVAASAAVSGSRPTTAAAAAAAPFGRRRGMLLRLVQRQSPPVLVGQEGGAAAASGSERRGFANGPGTAVGLLLDEEVLLLLLLGNAMRRDRMRLWNGCWVFSGSRGWEAEACNEYLVLV